MDAAKPGLLVIPSLFPADEDDITGIFILDYLRAVSGHNEITVLDIRPQGSQPGTTTDLIEDFRVIRATAASPRKGQIGKLLAYLSWLRLGRKIGAQQTDAAVIHAHGSPLHGNLALLIGRSLNIPVVISEHSGPFSRLLRNPVIARLTRHALEHADMVLVVSHDLEKQVKDAGIRPKNMRVSYNPVDTELFHMTDRMPLGTARNFVFAGRLEDYKGGLRAARAFANIMHRIPDWNMTIIGDGPERRDIEALIADRPGRDTRIRLTGQLHRSEIAEHFRQSAVFVFPSEHETFGIVIAEAMSTGLPVIVGNRTAPPEFVDKTCGLLVDPTDESDIAEAMLAMANDLDRYNSETIRKSTVERFGLNAFGKRLDETYRDALTCAG